MGRLARHRCSRCVVDPDNEAAWCACDRLLVWSLVLVVLVVALAFGGLPDAHADTWDDAVSGDCPEGYEYRGYHREIVRCPSCRTRAGQSVPWQVNSAGCRGCGNCSDGTQFYQVCPGDTGYPVPACVAEPGTPDEEQDAERLGDILANLGGPDAASGNPFGGGNGSQSPLSLFGDPVGAVEADDIVPQSETAPGSGEYECPVGTTLIESGDDEGYCRVSDQCAFYGATAGTWPDCSCRGFNSAPEINHPSYAPLQWVWDSYSLRCMPGERAQAPLSPLDAPGGAWQSRGYLWNLVCGVDVSQGAARGYIGSEAYLTQSSPQFVVRRGGVEAIAYNSAITLSTGVGSDSWTTSADEEEDEETFGSVICDWLVGPMSNVEQAFAGFGIARRANSCPTLSIPFFSQAIRVDVHCVLIGRWLGLIQAIAVVAYSFLGVRYIWGLRGTVGQAAAA